MATWSNLYFQDSLSPLMEQMIFFHDHVMLTLVLIISFVGYTMSSILLNSFTNRFLLDGQTIEFIWTFIPILILIFIAFPSLRLLYLLDEIYEPAVTLKALGHQWYWSYEYSDFLNVEFDSYMLPPADSQFRLLDVDNRTILPMNNQIRVIVSATDVIHSWTVPSLAVKLDAIPGRLNQASFLLNRPGVYYGQCSEICGTNHSFMPIVIESTNLDSFLNFISSYSP